MAEIRRLSINNPTLNTPTNTFVANGYYIMSVISANKNNSSKTFIDIWIAPGDTATESEWGYIVKNLPIDPGDSFETFRFAMIQDDYLYVKSDNGNASFVTSGIHQVGALG